MRAPRARRKRTHLRALMGEWTLVMVGVMRAAGGLYVARKGRLRVAYLSDSSLSGKETRHDRLFLVEDMPARRDMD